MGLSNLSTSKSHAFRVNMFLLVSITVLFTFTVVSSAYLGPRYGKRGFDGETLGRFVPSDNFGNRHIQVRSGARFYPGTRFGGKRSYWAAKPIQPQPDLDEHSAGSPSVGESPYDCFYIPQIGVRCISPEESNSWMKNVDDISRRETSAEAKQNRDGDIVNENVGSLPLGAPRP